MLLTLTATALKPLLMPSKGDPELDLLDLPAFTKQQLGLHGLNLSTDLLVGAHRDLLEKVRERADKAGCACLLLVEREAQPLGVADDAKSEAAMERMHRVIQAAHLLGCNAAALTPSGTDNDDTFDRTVLRLRELMERAERLELNLLIGPGKGLTAQPERVTEMIKKVGGFRVHTFPDFETASKAEDGVAYLRRLTPYASIVSASTVEFVPDKDAPVVEPDPEEEPDPALAMLAYPDEPVIHTAYELDPLVGAILSVGYDATLAVDYRGKGDVTLGVSRSRSAIEASLNKER